MISGSRFDRCRAAGRGQGSLEQLHAKPIHVANRVERVEVAVEETNTALNFREGETFFGNCYTGDPATGGHWVVECCWTGGESVRTRV